MTLMESASKHSLMYFSTAAKVELLLRPFSLFCEDGSHQTYKTKIGEVFNICGKKITIFYILMRRGREGESSAHVAGRGNSAGVSVLTSG